MATAEMEDSSCLVQSKTSHCQKYPAYKFKQINTLLRNREIGSASNIFRGKSFRCNDNSHSDLEFLRTLLCDKHAYLETIACRKIPRSKAPAFCHGRLFTENYQTWFNLFTGPTSGPLLMTSNLLMSNNTHQPSSSTTNNSHSVIKVVDIACVVPPYNCKPPSDRKWRGPRVMLLTKVGWLYEADLESCEIIQKVFIPTKEYTSSVFELSEDINDKKQDEPLPQRCQHIYHYITVNRESESIVIKSSRSTTQSDSSITTAYCMLSLYPLRIHSHFVVSVASQTHNPPYSAEIVNDMFIVNATRSSRISFYSLKDVISEHNINRNFSIKQKVRVLSPFGSHPTRMAEVGDSSLGIPYTTRNIPLSSMSPLFNRAPCLFKTAAIRHCLQLGGVPYLYLISTNKAGTSWALKHINDDSEVSSGRLQVEEKWDSTHWHGVHFHGDDTGRFLKQNLSSLEMLSIEHRCCDVEETAHSCIETPLSKLSSHVKHTSSCCVVNSFTIDVKPVMGDGVDMKWQYPTTNDRLPLPPHTVTSHGRPIRRPRPWYSYQDLQSLDSHEGYILVSAEYDQELNLIVLVYYRPTEQPKRGWESEDGKSELVVSLFDSFFGKHLSTFVLETDTSPSDRDVVSVTLDQDTFVYTRLRANDNRVQYKILRINRKFGFSMT